LILIENIFDVSYEKDFMAIEKNYSTRCIFISCILIDYPQKLSIDYVNSICAFHKKSHQNQTSFQKPLTNFYNTDSIFPLQSAKGYIPSLLCNFREQVISPFKFNTKQWLITSASIGITAVLILVDNDIDNWARVQK
jgi:hypothetical protein